MKWLKKNKDSSAPKQEDEFDLFAPIEDRVTRYEESQVLLTPKQQFKEIRFYWALGAILNLVGVGLMLSSTFITLSRNFDVELNLVRVDGGQVTESFDVRRNVMIKNTLDRIRLKSGIKEDESGDKG